MEKNNNKLSFTPLVFLIIGSMVGAGVFSLPADMAAGSSAGAMLIGWIITGVGMIGLALVYQNLSMRRPDLNSGVYSYAKAGFGEYIGFNAAWGYWVSAVCANVSYCVVIFNALGYFIPSFAGERNIPALIGGSLIIWVVQLLIANGVKQATIINVIVQIAKLVPILLFVVMVLVMFKMDNFTLDFFGKGNPDLGSIGTQIKSTMVVTLWVFIGIEGAVVVSERAKIRKDVGKATVMGLIGALLIYMMVSLLTFGYMNQQEIAGLSTPSMAYAMEQMVGPWGAALINLAMMISVLGALLGWTILASEVLYVAAKDKLIPKMFVKENKHGTPINSLTLTSLLLQALLLISFFSAGTYQMAYSISTSAILIPYLLSGLYGFKIAITGETYDKNSKNRTLDLIFSAISSIYSIWLIFAAGLNYILLVTILYAIGIFMYIKVRKENGNKLFENTLEIIIFVLLTVLAIIAIFLLATGKISY